MSDSVVIDKTGWFVYVLWGHADAEAVYVGQSINVWGRIGNHMSNAEKRRLTARIEIITCASEAEMRETETRLINEYRPLLNSRIPHSRVCTIDGCGSRSYCNGLCSAHRAQAHRASVSENARCNRTLAM